MSIREKRRIGARGTALIAGIFMLGLVAGSLVALSASPEFARLAARGSQTAAVVSAPSSQTLPPSGPKINTADPLSSKEFKDGGKTYEVRYACEQRLPSGAEAGGIEQVCQPGFVYTVSEDKGELYISPVVDEDYACPSSAPSSGSLCPDRTEPVKSCGFEVATCWVYWCPPERISNKGCRRSALVSAGEQVDSSRAKINGIAAVVHDLNAEQQKSLLSGQTISGGLQSALSTFQENTDIWGQLEETYEARAQNESKIRSLRDSCTDTLCLSDVELYEQDNMDLLEFQEGLEQELQGLNEKSATLLGVEPAVSPSSDPSFSPVSAPISSVNTTGFNEAERNWGEFYSQGSSYRPQIENQEEKPKWWDVPGIFRELFGSKPAKSAEAPPASDPWGVFYSQGSSYRPQEAQSPSHTEGTSAKNPPLPISRPSPNAESESIVALHGSTDARDLYPISRAGRQQLNTALGLPEGKTFGQSESGAISISQEDGTTDILKPVAAISHIPTEEDFRIAARQVLDKMGCHNKTSCEEALWNVYKYGPDGDLPDGFGMRTIGAAEDRVQDYNKIAGTTVALNEVMAEVGGEHFPISSGFRPEDIGSSRHHSTYTGSGASIDSAMPGHPDENFTWAGDYVVPSGSASDKAALVALASMSRRALNDEITARGAKEDLIVLNVGAAYSNTPTMVHIDTRPDVAHTYQTVSETNPIRPLYAYIDDGRDVPVDVAAKAFEKVLKTTTQYYALVNEKGDIVSSPVSENYLYNTLGYEPPPPTPAEVQRMEEYKRVVQTPDIFDTIAANAYFIFNVLPPALLNLYFGK